MEAGLDELQCSSTDVVPPLIPPYIIISDILPSGSLLSST
jgi:hypothetical protein